MKSQLQVAMAALILGTCTAGIAYATEWEEEHECSTGQVCGEAKIKVKMDIKSYCKVTPFRTQYITLENKLLGDSDSADFKVETNAAYHIVLASANGSKLVGPGGNFVPVTYKTSRNGGAGMDLGAYDFPAGIDNYMMTASVAYKAGLPAGTYEDTYTATVTF
jgi:hypothetical protein